MEEVNPDFKAGLDVVASAKEHFSDPIEILDDAKSRITGSLGLDTKVTAVKDKFAKSLGIFATNIG